MYGVFRDRLSERQTLAVIALIALNPVLWGLRNEVISDLHHF